MPYLMLASVSTDGYGRPPKFETDANGRTPKPKGAQTDAPQTSLHNIQPHVKTGSTVFHPLYLPDSKLLKLPHRPGFESGTLHLQVNHSTTRVLTRSGNTFLRGGIVILVQKKFYPKNPNPLLLPSPSACNHLRAYISYYPLNHRRGCHASPQHSLLPAIVSATGHAMQT